MLTNIKEKIKSRENEIFFLAIIVLLGVTAVGALRLFLLTPEKPPIVIQENAFSVIVPEGGGDVSFVASKNGTKYYPPNCKAADRIKEENRIYFASAINAQKAGFERTVSCSASPAGKP